MTGQLPTLPTMPTLAREQEENPTPPGEFTYLQPGGVDGYLQPAPDDAFTYLQPA